MKKILTIFGHPRIDSYCKAITDSYISGAKKSGAEIKSINVADLKFNPNLERMIENIELESDLKKAQEDIKWADHITFIYPLWWGYMPALLKGFIDRTFEAGFAAKYSKWGIPVGLLKGKSARIITTMDAPPFWYNLTYSNPGSKVLKKCVLKDCGFKPIKTTQIGPMYKSTDNQRKEWLNKIYKIGLNE